MATLRQLLNTYGVGCPVTWATKHSETKVKITSEVIIGLKGNSDQIQLSFYDKDGLCSNYYGADSLNDFEYDLLIAMKGKKEKKENRDDNQINPYFKDALNLADLMNLKPGDIIYLNHTHLNYSKKMVFSHIDFENEKLVVVVESKYGNKYRIDHHYLCDCGVIPYKGIMNDKFNKVNCLTKNPLSVVK